MNRRTYRGDGRHLIAASVLGLSLAACGTTVPLNTTAQSPTDGGLGSTTGTQGSNQTPAGSGSGTTDGGVGSSTGASQTSTSGSSITGTSGSNGAAGASGTTGPEGGFSSGATNGTPGKPSSSPVKLGFLMIDYSSVAASFGFSGQKTDVFQGFKEMVRYLNQHGGLAGRQIKGDYYAIDGSSSNASQVYQAACTHFTEDVKDELIISDGNFNPTFETCLAKKHLLHIDVSTYGLDPTGQRQYPAYLTPTAFAVDRYATAIADMSVAKGLVKKGQKVGVLIEGCDANVRAYSTSWVASAKRLGFQVESVETVCNNGTGDLGSETSQIQAAVLKFRSDGVTSVSFLSFNEGFLAVLFAQGAEGQSWRPQYLLSSVGLPERGVESQGNGLSVPAAQLPQIRGLGWVPISDVFATTKGSPNQEAAKRFCKVLSPSQGGANNAPDSGTKRDFLGHYLRECDTMLLVRRMATVAGGNFAPAALTAAYPKAVDSLVSASNLNGAYRIVGSRSDGVFAAAPFSYEASCKCMQYTGSAETYS